MKKLMMMAMAVATAMTGSTVLAVDAHSYVQDGLIAQWDGIDNVGAGAHDATATTWKDLKGTYDLSLLSGGSWGDNWLNVSGPSAKGTVATPAYKTIEVVYRMEKNSGRILFCSGNKTGSSSYGRRFVLFDSNGAKCYFDGNKVQTPYIPYTFNKDIDRCSAAVYNDDNSVGGVYSNGVALVNPSTLANDWGVGDGVAMIGGRKESESAYKWYGRVYAIRLYDRVLNDTEVAANRKVDELRYFHSTPSNTIEITTKPATCGLYLKLKDREEGLAEDDTRQFTVPAESIEVTPGTRITCQGWKLYDADDNLKGSGTDTTCNYTHPGEYRRLEWQFKTEHYVTIASDNDHATANVTSQWVEENTQLALPATPDTGYDLYDWTATDGTKVIAGGALMVVRPVTLTAHGISQSITSGMTGNIVYVSEAGDDSNDGSGWATAKRSLYEALGALGDNDGLVIGYGTFTTTNTLNLASPGIVRGAGMDKTFVMPEEGCGMVTRGFHLNNADAALEDVCVTGFSRVSGGYEYFGIGLQIDTNGGTVRRCRLTGNTSGHLKCHGIGGALCAGKIVDSVIDGNIANYDLGAGGLYVYGKNARVENCLIANNTAGAGAYSGGGVWLQSGTLVNCTIVGNTNTAGLGGGVFVGTDSNNPARMYNCIVADNVAPGDAGPYSPNVKINGDAAANKYLFNCLVPGGCGTDTVAGSPEFVDAANGDYRLGPNSPAIDAGSDEIVECASTTDLDGNPRRVGVIDIGCYEADTTTFACGFEASKLEVFVGETVTLTAGVTGGTEGALEYAWTALEDTGVTLVGEGATATATLTEAGLYGFKLTVTDTLAGKSVSATREDYVYVTVKSVRLEPDDDFAAAIDAAIDGGEIILGEGTYEIPTQLTVDKALTIRGEGYDKTTIQLDLSLRSLSKSYNTKQTRVLYVNDPNALVTGVKITGGTMGGTRYQFGAGVWIGAKGGTVTNCWITDNISAEYYQRGGGAGLTGDKALLTHCIVSDNVNTHGYANSTYGGGVAIEAGLVDNCLIVRNEGGNGGGVSIFKNGRIKNCTIADNTSYALGGGIYWYGANKATEKVVNCIFANNVAASDATTGSPEWSASSFKEADLAKFIASVTHCAFYNAVTLGEDAVTVAYPFSKSEDGYYTLLPGCKAVDAGLAYEGMPAYDLVGTARDDTPDIGCYEMDTTKFTCSFEVSPTEAFRDETITFAPSLLNAPDSVTYQWTLTDEFGNETVYTDEKPVKVVGVAGTYTVRLVVTDVAKASNKAEWTTKDALHLVPRTIYATSAGTNPTMAFPYDTPDKAHTNLVEMTGMFADGQMLELDAGVHIVTGQFEVVKGVTVRGQGRELTTIREVWDGVSPSWRVAHLNHPDAVLEKVTVANGYYSFGNGTSYNGRGFGVLLDAKGGTLRDARVTGCLSKSYHINGAVGLLGADAQMIRCIVDSNTNLVGNSEGAVFASAGLIENCLVVSNLTSDTCGIRVDCNNNLVVVRNCTVTDNEAQRTSTSGIGVGGLYVTGPAHYINVISCIFAGNIGHDVVSANAKGYPETAILYNGTYYAPDAETYKASFLNNLTQVGDAIPVLGTNGIKGDPLFENAAACDYRLQVASPCRNKAARDGYWTRDDIDLKGESRFFGLAVDMGCYEVNGGPGLMMLMK